MAEIDPHETRRGLRGIAHEMVVIGPDDGDEEIAYRVTEPGRPERQQRLEGREFGRAQLEDQYRYQDGKHRVGERAQTLRTPSQVWHGRHPLLSRREPFNVRPNFGFDGSAVRAALPRSADQPHLVS